METQNTDLGEKYTTKYMGEITVVDLDIISWINGKYNSKDIQIASTGVIGFQDNFGYIMKLVDQYKEIHKITKKAIVENYKYNKTIKEYFKYHFDSLEESKIFKIFGIKTFNEFDITKAVEK
jgi:N-acetylglutamate synthase/N-acetylornithine aminotransferase